MKLHLPKMLTAALIAATAALAANTTVQAETTAPVYSGQIITWNNSTSGNDLANGKYRITTYDAATGFTVTSDERTGWGGGNGEGAQLISKDTTADRNTLRFAAAEYGQTEKTPVFTFSTVVLAGIVVDEGAEGFSISSKNGGDRKIYLGNNNATVAYSSINENFSITTNTGSKNICKIFLRGTQVIDVASEKTYTLTSRDGIEISGALTVQGGGTLKLNGAATLGCTIVNNNSTVTFTGAVTLTDSLSGFEATGTYVNYNDETADDGYAGALTYTLVKGGTYTLPEQVTWNSQNLTVTEGKVTIGDEVDKSTYHLNVADHSLDLADELNHNNLLKKVAMATGTTLNANASFAGTVEGTGTAKVNISAEKELTGTVTGVALTGAGTYVLATNTVALGNGVTLGEGWAGTVRVSNVTKEDNNTTWISNLTLANSWVELVNVKGYDRAWSSSQANLTANIALKSDGSHAAWELSAFASTDASGNPPYTMVATGMWKGDGTFKTAGGKGSQSMAVEYQGNISGWVGTFEANSPGLRRVTFSNEAKEVNASVVNTGAGVLQVVVNTDATFSKSVTADKLTINDGMTATLKGAATLGGLVSTGSLVVDADTNTVSISGEGNVLDHAITLKSGTLNLTGSYDISALEVQDKQLSYKGGEGVATGSGFEMLSGTITVVDKTAGTLNHSEATFLYGGQAVTVTDGIGTLAGEPNYSALWVNGTDTVRYAAAQTIAGGTTVESVHLNAEGATITMDQADAAVALVISEGVSGTVKATAATTLNSVTGLGEGQTLTITGNAPVTFGAAVTGSTVSVDGGTLNLGNRIHNLTKLSVVNGTVTAVGVDGGNGCVSGTISIGADGVFQTTGHHDVFGFHKNTATQKIVMGGTSGHMASLQLTPDGTGVTTMTTDIEMNGYAAITTKNGFNTYDCTITATGVENSIDQMYLRNNVTINVTGEGDVLTIGKLQRTSQFSGTITKEGEGTLVFNGTENYLDQAITVNGGTLALDGTFSIGAIAGTENASYAGGAVTDNGFKTSSTTRTVYTKGDGADVTVGKDAHFMVGEEEVKLLDNGTATTAATTDYAAFYVRHDSETVSKAYEQHEPTSFHLSENTGLVVDQDVTAAVRGAGASSKVTIEADRTLTGTARNVTIAGSGTYALDNATVALGSGVALAGEWAGIVSVSGVTFNGNFDTVCGNLAKGESWIELKDTKGYLNNGGSQTFTYDANLILSRGEDGWAYAQNNGNDNSVLKFTGTIVGDGNLGRSVGTGSTYTYEFTGDISRWNGQFISRNLDKKSTTFKLSGEHEGDMEVWATLVNKGTDFYVAVNTNATFNADVEATKVTVAENKTATFTEDATIGTIEGPGKVVVGGNATLTVTNSVAEGVQIEAESGATIAGGGIDAAQVGIAAEGGTATFADGIAQGNDIIFSAGAVVTNNGGEAAAYDTDKATMTVNAETLSYFGDGEAVIANKVVVDEIVNWSSSKLTLTNAESMELKSMTISPTSTVEMLYTDEEVQQEGTVTITDTLTAGGGTLLANLEMANGSKLDVNGGDTNALTLGSQFTIADGALVTLDNETLAAIAGLKSISDTVILINQLDGSNLTTNLTDGDWARTHFDLSSITDADFTMYVQEGQIGIMKSSNVPEPTTGTLSLLALMVLAARRRRH